jgi:virginiamycin A acetyltransferase
MTADSGPDPLDVHPMPGHPRVTYLKPYVTRPHIEVGDFTYYDDPRGADAFERNVLYHFEFIGDWLRIGRFCAIAAETKFIMNGANHRTDGFSSYPFLIFGGNWAGRFAEEMDFPKRGDTVIGNDVWVGYDSLIMPGVTIGDGAIVAARSVVTRDVPPYTIVGGNPAQPVKQRFDDATIAALLEIRWWDWSAEKITRNVAAIGRADLSALRDAT